MMGLTARQKEAFDFIVRRITEGGVSPNLQEIADGLGLRHKSGVIRIVKCLRERGYIDWMPGHGRSFVVLALERPAFTLPPKLQAALIRYCAENDEKPEDVVVDAVTLHLDGMRAQL